MGVLSSVYVEECENLLAIGSEVYHVLLKKEHGVYAYYRTENTGSILVKWSAKGPKVWLEADAPVAMEEGSIYRLLRKEDEDTLQRNGLVLPKNYFGEYTAEGHILHACRPYFRGSRFISASKSMRGICAYVTGLLRREQIDAQRIETFLKSVVVVVADIARLLEHSIRCIDAVSCTKGNTSYRYSAKTEEVLVDGEIPDDCIRDLEIVKPCMVQ